MDENYWLGRWERGETGWHQKEAEPSLIKHFSDLKPTRVFVPLCGKSLDLAWLASRGHEVIGVELSEAACRQFFTENRIPFQESNIGDFNIFRGGGIMLLNGDFFELQPLHLGILGAVYDRAALIALPKKLRSRYAAHMMKLLKECASNQSFRFLQIVLQRTPHDEEGPPHSIPAQELEELYRPRFKLSQLSCEPVDMGEPETKKTEECVYFFSRK